MLSAVRVGRSDVNKAISEDPAWIDAILDWRWTWLVSRIGLCSAYVLGGLAKLLYFQAAIAEQEHFGLRPPVLWAAAAIAVQIASSFT